MDGTVCSNSSRLAYEPLPIDPVFGLLNLNKPAGCTSRDVVNQVGRIVGRKVKAGHAGTLDPLASGVLIVCLGPATRLVPLIHEHSKTYRGTFRLGLASDTEDITGNLQPVDCPPGLAADQLREVLPKFLGAISQAPPAYSAVKVAGQRAYDLARQGTEVQLEPRTVHVHGLKLLEFSFPDFALEIDCGTGTYVRSLGRDIAEQLGTSAVMTDLVRTRIGPFLLEEAISLEGLNRETLREGVHSPLHAIPQVPKVEVDSQQIAAIRQGRAIPLAHSSESAEADATRCALVSSSGELIAIAQRRGELWGPALVFPAGE